MAERVRHVGDGAQPFRHALDAARGQQQPVQEGGAHACGLAVFHVLLVGCKDGFFIFFQGLSHAIQGAASLRVL